jgi:serine protease Do
VIEKPNINVTVVLANGTRVQARTLGTDHDADTGMLKITKAGEYPFVEVGESAPLKRGEWVVALGHPGGYQPPRPAVARLGRILTSSVTGANQLGTDCTLIMGDSGGPLFDLEGHVIGIHSKISLGTDNNMHVPVDLFLKSWLRLARGDDWGGTTLVAKGKEPPQGGSLDISGVDDPNGVRVDVLGLNSPAGKAGLKVGDVVKKIDDTPVATAFAAWELLGSYRPGEQVSLEILRGSKTMTLKVTLAPRLK